MPTANQGIIVAGSGSLSGGQIAVETGAHITAGVGEGAVQTGLTLEQLRKELDDLLQLVRRESARIPPEVVKGVEAVTKEVTGPEPNKVVVTSVLDSVARLVTSFGTLSGSIIAVKELAVAVLK